MGTGAAARERLDTDYAGMKREWQAGYAAGLADAGLNLSRSMRDLAGRPVSGGYSAGYMQVRLLLCLAVIIPFIASLAISAFAINAASLLGLSRGQYGDVGRQN